MFVMSEYVPMNSIRKPAYLSNVIWYNYVLRFRSSGIIKVKVRNAEKLRFAVVINQMNKNYIDLTDV